MAMTVFETLAATKNPEISLAKNFVGDDHVLTAFCQQQPVVTPPSLTKPYPSPLGYLDINLEGSELIYLTDSSGLDFIQKKPDTMFVSS